MSEPRQSARGACTWRAKAFPQTRANSLSLQDWAPLANAIGDRADTVIRGLGAEISKELAYLEKAWPRDLPQGVIHADLFPDNVFFLGRRCRA
jgi:homoserine kinase type II